MPPTHSTSRVLSTTGPSRRRAFAAAGLAAIVAVAIAACGGGSSSSSASPVKDGFTQAPQTSGPLTVWVDSTRVPAARAYQKAHPDVKLNVVTYDGDANGSNFLQTKIDLFNRTGKGWPDVVFSTQQNETTWAVSAGYSAPLSEGLIPQSTLSNFATGSLSVCTVNGKVYCLRNDLAQTVLWYNAALMKKWGYQVPTTWPAAPATHGLPKSTCGPASARAVTSPVRAR
jgi:ABC-type glycerol-3-phosphate transport system substrate-binding protein